MQSKRTIPRVCERCGTSFLVRSDRSRPGRFCSETCRVGPRTILICPTCGASFTRKPAKCLPVNYCSHKCRRVIRGDAPAFEISDDSLTARIPLRDAVGNVLAYAIVDAADAEFAGKWTWCLVSGYAQRRESTGGRKNHRKKAIQLHRELLGLKHGDARTGDHIDRDRLNCRRSNLRILPPGGNAQNKSSAQGSSSQYRGVSWNKNDGKWYASLRAEGKRYHLGSFVDEHEAGRVVREARLRLMVYAVD